MTSRGAATLRTWLLPSVFFIATAAVAPTTQATPANTLRTATHAVTATPPLLAVPATPVSKNVQQRMRACNASADAKKLAAAGRETFIKACMAVRRNRAASRHGSQPKAHP